MAMFKRVHKIRCFSLKWNTDTRFSVNPQFSLWKAMSVLPAGCMSFALLNLPDTYVLEFFVWHDLTDHRRIQEAGVLSVIERSGGLFGQVLKMETFCLKMEETPKWHKMTIVSPKKVGTLITNLHYVCWDLPFFNLLGMATAAVRSSLWPGYSAGPFWGIWDGRSHGKTEEFSSSKIWGGSQNGADLIRRRSGPEFLLEAFEGRVEACRRVSLLSRGWIEMHFWCNTYMFWWSLMPKVHN